MVNNGLHESVGGQPTVGQEIDFPLLAKSCGYQYAETAASAEEILSRFREMRAGDGGGAWFLEIRVKKGVKEPLGRPKSSPEENKRAFVQKYFADDRT